MKNQLFSKFFQSTVALALSCSGIALGTAGCHRSDAHKELPNNVAGKSDTSDKFGGGKASQTESTGNPSDASVPTMNSKSGQYGSTANTHDPNSSPNPPVHVNK